jgi:nucleoid DNA-binding protein
MRPHRPPPCRDLSEGETFWAGLSFGTFTVKKTNARKALNPRTGEAVKVKAGKTARFKASPTLKKVV